MRVPGIASERETGREQHRQGYAARELHRQRGILCQQERDDDGKRGQDDEQKDPDRGEIVLPREARVQHGSSTRRRRIPSSSGGPVIAATWGGSAAMTRRCA